MKYNRKVNIGDKMGGIKGNQLRCVIQVEKRLVLI